MPNIFKGMNRKQKREFDKLDNEKKAEILQSAIVNKVSDTMVREIANAIITGGVLERELIYNRYVSEIDAYVSGTDDWIAEVEKLLSYIRMSYLRDEQKKT